MGVLLQSFPQNNVQGVVKTFWLVFACDGASFKLFDWWSDAIVKGQKTETTTLRVRLSGGSNAGSSHRPSGSQGGKLEDNLSDAPSLWTCLGEYDLDIYAASVCVCVCKKGGSVVLEECWTSPWVNCLQ